MSTREAYCALFPTLGEALEHEGACLSVGDEFLPACAIAVRDDTVDEPTAEYWAWLAEQWTKRDEGRRTEATEEGRTKPGRKR
jgi:hypothetical protein